nr:hypothetical protein [Tanacetum cinerariifolium]
MEDQTFKETIIQNKDSIEKCIIERARHKQEIQNRLKRLNERKLQIQEVKASNASSGDTNSYRIVSDKGNDQSLKNQSRSGDESSRSRNECNDKSNFGDYTDIRPSYDTEPTVEVNSNTTPDSSDMCNNEFKDDQNVDDHEDERVVLAKLIANLNCDIDENKKIQKESDGTRDRYLVALNNKEVKLAKYKTFKDRAIENDTLERGFPLESSLKPATTQMIMLHH